MSLRSWDTIPISIEGINGWDSTRVAVRGQKYCPWWLTYLNPSTGDVFDYGKPCRSFSHRPCAEKRVAVLLDHIGTFILSSRSEFWVAAGQDDDGLATRMRVRRSKSKARTGEEVHAFWIRRSTGVFYYFATAALPGSSEPSTGAWVGSETAFTVARAALTLPGVGDPHGRKGVNFTAAWQPGSTQNRTSGLIRISQQKPKASRIAVDAARRIGSGPPSQIPFGDGWGKPDGVDLVEWNGVVAEVATVIDARG